MTGKFFYIDKKNKKYKTSFYYDLDQKLENKHDRVVFFLENKQQLIYNDIRKFGFIKLYKLSNFLNNKLLRNLGPEPLNQEFNIKYFKEFILDKKRNIKSILMDQKFISGLGNIYVNEALFLSGVSPTKKVENLKDIEIEK